MSFSTDVKEELLSLTLVSECCRHAEGYGMLLFGRTFSASSVSFAAENRVVAAKYAEEIRQIIDTPPDVVDNEGKIAVVSVRTAAERRAILAAFGHSPGELTLRINRANLANDCCFAAFIRGVFLACGTVSSPEKNYHLEFIVPFLKLSGDLFAFLQELGFHPKHIMRKGSLTLMGATNSTLRLINVKIGKDVRNHVNRRVNFETANIDRSVHAGSVQINAIRKIMRLRGLDALSDGLREVAELRLENPEASLLELEELLGGKLSRSGINHRLKRLVEIADQLT